MSSVLQAARSTVVDVTRTGEIFGTPHYMSPEQCLGEKADGRSDIYSFGCLMYEALNGRPPFIGVNPVQIIMRHLKADPPTFDICAPTAPALDSQPSSTAQDSAGCSSFEKMEQLERIVMRCLKKDPLSRYQSFDEVKADLETVLSGVHLPEQDCETFPSIKRRVLASAIDGVIIGSLFTFIGFQWVAMTPALGLAEPHVDVYWSLWRSIAAGIASLYWFSPEYWPSWVAINYFKSVFSNSPLSDWSVIAALFPVLSFVYHVVFESSPMRGTIGKRLTGLQIVNAHGERINFAHAALRFWAQFLLPYCVLTEYVILRQERLQRYNPVDRISQSFVVTRDQRNKVSTRGVDFPSPIPKTLVMLHWACRVTRGTILALFGCLGAVAGAHFILGVRLPVLLMIYCASTTLTVYLIELWRAKSRLLRERGELAQRLSFTAIFMRSLRSEKTQTKDS
jgi:uncharacterized RDD family membrane protein YckC